MATYRYICDVFEEMRKLHDTRNYASMLGLIEEGQSMANRMEAKLHEYKAGKIQEKNTAAEQTKLETLRAEIKKVAAELEPLRKQKKGLEDTVRGLKHQVTKETKGGGLAKPRQERDHFCCDRNSMGKSCDCENPTPIRHIGDEKKECKVCGGDPYPYCKGCC